MTPDLTPEHFRRCTAPDHYQEMVKSRSSSEVYRVSLGFCTCPGFKYRSTCSHTRALAASGKVCTWGEQWSDGTGEQETCPRAGCGKPTHGRGACDKHCPVCGRDTEFYTDMV